MRQELQLPVPGTMVAARGECWRVVDAVRHEDCAICRLEGTAPANRGAQRALLLPFDRLAPIAPRTSVRRVGRRGWLRRFAAEAARSLGHDSLRAAAAGRFDVLAYQLEPALALLAGATRVLLADEVGLGKTVQAALALAEIFARHPAARCLVLAPASLCPQWLAELSERFRLPASVADAASLRRLAWLSPPGAVIWEQQPLAITSFDYVKRPEVLPGVLSLRWDVLVVDEAHMASLAPERAAAVRALARRSRQVLLLTATPHASDSEGFGALCAIGRLPGDPPVVMFRRRRFVLGPRPVRRTRVIAVRPTAPERRLHAALGRYTGAVWRHSKPGTAGGPQADARLAMIVLRKRAASGPATLLASLARRLALLSALPGDPSSLQLLLPLEPTDDSDPADEEPMAVLAVPGLPSLDAERTHLSRLVDLARRACGADSKLGALARLLRRAREPVIVFTEYRDTLVRLAERLSPGSRPAMLHGGLDQAARGAAVRAFTCGRASLLLATDAGAHGLNLQARCRLVVNVELPWTPARLEQRIGRVDRIGQLRPVHAIHLVGRGTAEQLVLGRLVSRIERERAALGAADDPLGITRKVATEGDRPADAEGLRHEDDEVRRLDLSEIAEAERRRVEATRRLQPARAAGNARQARARAEGAGTVCWTVVRRRRALSSLPLGVFCLFAARFIDGRGSLVEETTVVLHVALDRRACGRSSLGRALPALLRRSQSALTRTAAIEASRRLDALRAGAGPRLSALAMREAAMTEPLVCAGTPFQAGLFGRREVEQAAEERLRREQDETEAARRQEALSREGTMELAGEPELVLVLGLAE
jgi:superfamily II DNA or RNA helicase